MRTALTLVTYKDNLLKFVQNHIVLNEREGDYENLSNLPTTLNIFSMFW